VTGSVGSNVGEQGESTSSGDHGWALTLSESGSRIAEPCPSNLAMIAPEHEPQQLPPRMRPPQPPSTTAAEREAALNANGPTPTIREAPSQYGVGRGRGGPKLRTQPRRRLQMADRAAAAAERRRRAQIGEGDLSLASPSKAGARRAGGRQTSQKRATGITRTGHVKQHCGSRGDDRGGGGSQLGSAFGLSLGGTALLRVNSNKSDHLV
jgi:hypothetical protein